MQMRSPLLLAAAVTALMVACATGTNVDTTDGLDSDAYDSGSNSNNNNNDPDTYADSGNPYQTTSNKDAGTLSSGDSGTSTGKDSGTTTSLDSGTTTAKDSGTTTTTGSDDCTGTTGAEIGESYDDECDAYYTNTEGAGENDCTVGGNDCSSLNGSGGYTFCCYNPKKNGNCYFDYEDTPQCVPQ